MSLAVRVIPCLDVDAGRVVKGVHFENLKDAGDPVELAAECRKVFHSQCVYRRGPQYCDGDSRNNARFNLYPLQ